MDFSQLQLQPYHLPAPIPWWPPAPGWWLLAGLVVLLIALLFILFLRWKKQAWRRMAKKELEAIQKHYENDQLNAHKLASQLSLLLRKTYLTRFHQAPLSGHIGESWLQDLEELVRGKVPFTSNLGRELFEAAYDPNNTSVGHAHITLCKDWINRLPAKPLFRFMNKKQTSSKQEGQHA